MDTLLQRAAHKPTVWKRHRSCPKFYVVSHKCRSALEAEISDRIERRASVESDEDNLNDYVMKIVDRAAASQAIKDRRCFACGGEPTSGFGEHVIPRWLQKRIGLANRQLTLINGTRIAYRQLTVPCCQVCNNGFLRKIENSVLEFTESPRAPKPTTRFACGRWLAKVLLGILVKESALLFDRQDPAKGPIVPAEFIEEFRNLQFILQSARKRTKFETLHADHPFTLFLYRIERDQDYENFDLTTNLRGQSIAIRFAGLGMIFVNDGGLQHEAGPKGPLDLEWRKLHPVQFSEVAAMVHYKATLRDATHTYMSFETPQEIFIHQTSVRPYSKDRFPDGTMKVFQEWSDLECAGFIERYRQVNWGPVFNPSTGMFHTTLRNERGGLPSPKKFAQRHD